MAEATWAAVDDYIVDTLALSDDTLEQILVASASAGLPMINVSPPQGRFLQLLARMVRAERILEIGTLGGYSTLWLARALPPGGRVVTLEANPHHAAVARANIERAQVAAQVDLRLGPALETLPRLKADGAGPFDLVFIDADKQSIADYLAWALTLTRPGSVILCDNVVRGGAVTNPRSPDERVQGVRRLFDRLAAECRLSTTALQTVGSKGWDGFTLSVVT